MDKYYMEILEKVEGVISRTLPAMADKGWLARVAGPAKSKVTDESINVINQPAIELMNRGGKRWRPVMMVLCCELSGGSVEEALSLAPVVEFPHNGSLIVDDIEDKSDLRRGEPAVHKLFGEDLSINTGNLLYFLPTFLIDESDFNDELKLRLYRYYNVNLRRLHLGQGLDIQWHNNHEFYPSVEEYMQMCRFKTGSLARLAAQIGFAVGGTDPNTCLSLGDVFEDAGVAFQIIDDVKNLTTGIPGKNRGDDIVEGKKSLPVILHAMADPDSIPELACYFEKAAGLGAGDGIESIEKAISLLDSSGSIERAQGRAFEMIRGAKSIIERSFQASTALDAVIEMFDGFLPDDMK
ncbi:MAG: polyprenyl synthetase family protein [Spirochaetales bacterium]|uniref:Polyprenyl synthetase family protein n=1 Tax=Candidatus Thalassospirochaeta sargassi TaxID=3119039 RepID=A0AAJ1IFT0_9SPIO|nr:polyprenyl synthetase family protein [Spirochaetales bacterium]